MTFTEGNIKGQEHSAYIANICVLTYFTVVVANDSCHFLHLFLFIRIIYKFLNACPFDNTAFVDIWKVWFL